MYTILGHSRCVMVQCQFVRVARDVNISQPRWSKLKNDRLPAGVDVTEDIYSKALYLSTLFT